MYRNTERYRKAIRKRAVWVEPLFGEAKDWHGLRRFRLRRLEKVNTEALLKAAGQNVKRLLAFGARGPKGSAQVLALRQLAPNLYEFRGVRRHRSRCSRHPASVFQHAEVFSEVWSAESLGIFGHWEDAPSIQRMLWWSRNRLGGSSARPHQRR